MINSIVSLDNNLIRVDSTGPFGPYQSGAVYWNGHSQKMSVITGDGLAHDMNSSHASISVGQNLTQILAWAHKKMNEDEDLDKLCKAYPNLDDARKEFAMLHRLVQDNK